MKKLFCELLETGVIGRSGVIYKVHLKWDWLHNCIKYYRTMSKVWTLSLNLGSFYFLSGNPSYIVTTALGSSNCSLPSYPFMKFLSNYPNQNKLFAFYKDCEVGFWHQISCVFEKCRQNLPGRRKGKANNTGQGWHQLLKLSPVVAWDEIQVEGKVLGG